MNEVANRILQEIRQHRVISFARFMELALYCPNFGYYEKKWDNPGRRGDFYTSVSVGSLFGEMLAFQFAEWLEESTVRSPQSTVRSPQSTVHNRGPAHIIEAGAHDGQLAKDILKWLSKNRPELFRHLEYWIVEPSPNRRQWQEQTLRDFRQVVHWASNLVELGAEASRSPSRPITSAKGEFRTVHPALPNPHPASPADVSPRSQMKGEGSAKPELRTPHSAFRIPHAIIFSNELLDSFPVHRLSWDANKREWFEWGVAAEAGRFVWTRLPTPTLELGEAWPHRPQSSGSARLYPQPGDLGDLASVLPDQFTIECCPLAQHWWQEAAAVLAAGKLMTLDFGLSSDELFAPERSNGNLRAYQKHHLSADLLASPGCQDLTAHINFSAIQSTGEAAGLRTEALVTQEQFLTGIAQRIWAGEPAFQPWTTEYVRQFQTLTHPSHLGHAFRVLVQAR